MAGATDQKKWQIATEAVEDLLAGTPADVSIALVTFSDKVHDIFDFGQSRSSMLSWLQKGASRQGDSRVHGTTALFDALQMATKLFAPPHPGDAMYLISDAGDNSSHVRSRKIRELLLRSQIRLFVFLFADPFPLPDEELETESIKEIARATGGFVFGDPSYYSGVQGFSSWEPTFHRGERTREKIQLYTQSLNMQVNGFYTLRFDLPGPPGKARKVSLEVVDATGKTRKDVAFTYSTLLPQPKKVIAFDAWLAASKFSHSQLSVIANRFHSDPVNAQSGCYRKQPSAGYDGGSPRCSLPG